MQRTSILLCLAASQIIPGSAQNAATTSPAFDVASVHMEKDVDPNHVNSHWSSRAGKFTGTGIQLREIIQHAYNVKNYQITGPDWLTSERYDIMAVWPPDTPNEQFPFMLQTFLADRFKLTFHRVPKLLPVYELRVAKNGPKLQAAPVDGHNSMNGHNGHWTAQHVSMAGLADMLSNQASRPVLDKTGLSGFFNFEFQFTPENRRDDANSSDAGPSIFTAVEEQLGLKLVPEKGSIDILIVDHLEKVPTEN